MASQPKKSRMDYSNGVEAVLRKTPVSCYGLNAFANNKMLPASRDPRIKRCSEAFDSHKELYSKQTCTIPGVQSCNQNRGHVPRRIDPRLAKANRNSTRDSGFVPVRSHTHAQQPNPTKKTGVTGVEKKYIKNEVCIPQTEQIRQTSLHESYLCNQNYPALHESVVDFHCYPGTLPGHSRGGFSNTQWPGGFGPQNNNVITERVASNKTNHFRQDLPRTIPIDGIQREIRFYGEQAVVLIADDDPRLLGFMPGWRRVFLNDAVVNLATCGDYEEFVFNGRTHKIKIGTPTREVYIDGAWYECTFGGNSVVVKMGEQYVQLSLEGPAPHVQIGSVRNFDHLAGRIFMEVGPNWVIPVYLDQKPQCVCLGGRMVNLQFEDSLRVVLIDGLAHPVNFDGHLTEVFVDGYQMFIRFSALPQGVKPGTVFQPIIQNPVAPSLGALPKTDASHGLPVDVKELLSRLIQKGLLPTVSDTSSESLSESEEKACIEFNLSNKDRKSMRDRLTPLIKTLYTGKQCGTCGLRFAADKAERHTSHLDWHFRQNRKKKENSLRNSVHRSWYQDQQDWIKFQEVEEILAEPVFKQVKVSTPREDECPSVPVGSLVEDSKCRVCFEDFDQFYHQEKEEWHLKNAVRLDGITFHTSCYPDFANSACDKKLMDFNDKVKDQ